MIAAAEYELEAPKAATAGRLFDDGDWEIIIINLKELTRGPGLSVFLMIGLVLMVCRATVSHGQCESP